MLASPNSEQRGKHEVRVVTISIVGGITAMVDVVSWTLECHLDGVPEEQEEAIVILDSRVVRVVEEPSINKFDGFQACLL